MSTDDIGGPISLAARLDALGVNKGNHEPAPSGAIYVGDLHASAPTFTESKMDDTFRIEFDYPVNTVVEKARDGRQAWDWMRSARGRALPDWIEVRLIRTRKGVDEVLERYFNDPSPEVASPSPERRVLQGDLTATPGDYFCTRCGRDEIDARANGCASGPCPMEPKRPILFVGGQAIMLDVWAAPNHIDLYDRERGNVRYEPTSAPWRAARPFIPGLLLGVAALVVVLLWKLHG